MLRDRRAQRRNNSKLAWTGKRFQRGRDPKQDMDKGEALRRKKKERATESEILKVSSAICLNSYMLKFENHQVC